MLTKFDTRINSLIIFSLIVLLFGFSSTSHCAPKQQTKKATIAFLPFESHSAKDLSYLTSGIRDMLASRLASGVSAKIIDKSSIDEALTKSGRISQPSQFQQLAKKLEANYLVTGSLTAFGSSLSLDAKVYDRDGVAQNFYATAATEDDIIMAIDQLAWNIAEKIFNYQPPAQSMQMATPSTQTPSQPAYQTAHPERAFMGNGNGRYGAGSPFIRPGGNGPFGFTKSQNFKLDLQSMDIGDVDGDGQDEVVIADRQEVQIYKRDGNRFAKVGQLRVLDRYKIHSVTLADLNNNGKEEIYVSAADHKEPNSFGAEWKEKTEADYLFKDARWYIRAMKMPGEGMVLLGQRSSVSNPVSPGIYHLNQNDSGLQQGERVALPDSINLFDFSVADLDNDGAREIIAIDQHDRLIVMRPSGSILWKSDEYYGGTTRFIGGQATLGMADAAKSKEDLGRIYVPSRIIVTDTNNDGLPDVVLNKNLSTSSRVFKNMKSYPSGEIHILTWNGISLSELMRTSKIDGYIADYQLIPNEDNSGAELFVGLVLRTGGLNVLSSKTSTVLTYQLDYALEPEKSE